MTANWRNRTLWTGDNLDIMRGMNSESVDLIYLDPPFNSNQDYSAPIGSEAAGAAFKDTWTLSDVDEAWHGEIADRQPALYAIIDAADLAHGKGMKSYLIMMAVRLLEMHRLIKPTGSIYLHCDPTASHYLKMMMDAIFTQENFRSEIVWKRTGSHGGAKRWGPIHDTILFYAKGSAHKWNRIFQPYLPEYLDTHYTLEDERGRYQPVSLTGSGVRTGDSGQPWRGIDPTQVGRHWAIPRAALRTAFPDRGDLDSLTTQERLDLLDEAGLIHWPERGTVPRQKRYADESPGVPIQDIVTDINPAGGGENVGYPTQKPVALLDRIIRASTTPGDMVLDPFCGCATALVAADRLDRQWAGIDLSPLAARLVLKRLRDDRGPLFDDVIHREDVPRRTDLGRLPNYRTHKHTLYGRQEGVCAGCQVLFPFRNLTVDHVIPQAKGGSDHRDNLQLLCGACNSMKGTGSQEQLIVRLTEQGIRQ